MLGLRGGSRTSVLLAAGWCALSLVVPILTRPGSAQEHDGGRRPPRYPGPGPSFQRGFEEPADATLAKGFAFIEGEYLSPPYELRETADGVYINGRQLRCLLPEVENYRGEGSRGGPGHGPPGAGLPGGGPRGDGLRGDGPRGSGMMRGASPLRRLAWNARYQLESNGVLLSFADQPLVTLDGGGSAYALFKLLTTNAEPIRRVSLAERLPDELDRSVWNGWLDRYQAPENLRGRAAALVAAYDASEQQAMSEIAATRRLNALAYPLTLGSFFITVLAVGHLLGGRPHAGKSPFGQDTTPEMIQALNWTLVLLGLLTAMDLAWTILAAQANQMRELNPLGSHLIDNPRQLIGFKVGATFPSLALLWLLRKYKRAQIAAWWICLILTVLAFRWLSYNSAWVAA